MTCYRAVAATLFIAVLICSGVEAHAHIHGVTDPHSPHTPASIAAVDQLAYGVGGPAAAIRLVQLACEETSLPRTRTLAIAPHVPNYSQRAPPATALSG